MISYDFFGHFYCYFTVPSSFSIYLSPLSLMGASFTQPDHLYLPISLSVVSLSAHDGSSPFLLP